MSEQSDAKQRQEDAEVVKSDENKKKSKPKPTVVVFGFSSCPYFQKAKKRARSLDKDKAVAAAAIYEYPSQEKYLVEILNHNRIPDTHTTCPAVLEDDVFVGGWDEFRARKYDREGPQPPTLLLAMTCGGQLVCLALHSGLAGLVDMVVPADSIPALERLFMPEGSLPAAVVGVAQFAFRAVVAGFGAVACVGLGLIGPVVGLGVGAATVMLTCSWDFKHVGTSQLLQLASSVAPTIAVYHLYLGDSDVIWPFLQLFVTVPVLVSMGCFKVAAKRQREQREAREGKSLLSKAADAVVDAAGDTVVGEITTEGKSSDVTLRDAVSAVRGVKDAVDRAKKGPQPENVFHTLGRLSAGVACGVALYLGCKKLGWDMLLSPVVTAAKDGRPPWLWTYMWHGIRKANAASS